MSSGIVIGERKVNRQERARKPHHRVMLVCVIVCWCVLLCIGVSYCVCEADTPSAPLASLVD